MDRYSRKQFLKNGFWGITGIIGELFDGTFSKLETLFPEIIRPPGATPEPLFQKTCTRCDECLKSCPYFAIRKYYGPAMFIEETPTLILGYTYCRMCNDFPCISACGSGALVLPPEGEKIVIGQASVKANLCLRKKGEPCKICVECCDKKNHALVLNEQKQPPSVLPDRCNGCGACENHCPVQPQKAISVHPK